jgi:fibronectin type 3 domain-containing protein
MSEPALTEPSINLSWTAPTRNIDGSQPANILGYNLYRFSQGQDDPGSAPLNSTLISSTSYADRSFKFGENYRYLARTVSLGSNGQQVESLNSNEVSANPKDTYPPAAPVSPTVAPAPGRLSIFFPQNLEADVAGYNIYRSTDPNLPKPWTKLNDDLLTRTTYQDQKVESGRRYYYYLTAVDTSGNVSAPSEVFSETAP